MKRLAEFILKSRINAIGVTTLLAVGSLFVPFLGYLSGASVGLVSLRLGPASAGSVVVISTLLLTLFAFAALESPTLGITLSLVVWLPVWMAASILRSSVSLSLAVDAITVTAVVAVLAFHLLLADPAQWWQGLIERIITDTPLQIGVDEIGSIARIMTGLIGAILFLSVVASLLIARWWQAMLFNPGGFGDEFRRLRVSRATLLASTLVLGLALFEWSLMGDLAVLVMVLYLLAGLALVHALNSRLKISHGWLVGFYGVVLLFPAQMVAILSAVGFADAWLDFRRRLPAVR